MKAGRFFQEHQAGLYVTLIFHLLLLLALSINQIRAISKPSTILVELESRPYVKEKEKPKDPEQEKEELKRLEKELNEMINSARTGVKPANIVVNASARENGNSQSYADKPGMNMVTDRSGGGGITKQKSEEKNQPKIETDKGDIETTQKNSKESVQGQVYKGPSVVSYYLDDREAISLPVPAYKCKRGGDVVVIIDVSKTGYVTSAEVDRKKSSSDDCLCEAAVQAALNAKFTHSPDNKASQKGNIVYRFVSQN